MDKRVDTEWARKRKSTMIVFGMETFLFGCEYGVTVVNLWLYLTHLVKPNNPTMIYSLIFVIYLLSAAIFSLVVGMLVDRTRNVRTIFLCSNVMLITGNIIYTIPFSFWFLLIGRFLCGVGHGLRSVMTGEIARCYKDEKMSSVMSIMGAAHATGFTIAPVFNILFSSVHITYGTFQVTFANVSGIYMSAFFLITELLAFFFVHDLSKEFDLKSEFEFSEERTFLRGDIESMKCVDDENEPFAEITENERSLVDKVDNDINLKWLFKELFTHFDPVILFTLQFLATFFLYSFDMVQPMIFIDTLKWSLPAYNGIVIAAGAMTVIPFIFLMMKSVSTKQIYCFSAFGVFGYCVLQACQMIWMQKLLSPTGNIALSVVYVLLWVEGAFIREVFITGFLARMVSTQVQASVDGIRLAISKLGAITALSSAPYALRIIDRIGIVYILVQAFIGVLVIVRCRTLMNPNVIIK